jgi:hypothetical protein
MASEETTPQPADIDAVIAVIDPNNEVAIRALLAFKRRFEAFERRLEHVELEQVVHRSFINKHEAILSGSGTPN